jgi:hypothetical protein
MVKRFRVRPWGARLLLSVLLSAGGTGTLRSQDVRLSAAADTNSIRIGEQVRVSVSVEHPPGYLVKNVGPADSLGGLEIVRVDSVPGAATGGAGAAFRRIYTFTAFDSGTYVVPPFVAYYTAPSDTAVRSVSGSPIAVFVHGVDVDTSKEIRAIKPPLDVPLTFAEILPWLLAALGVAGLSWLVYYILKKRKRGEKFIPGPPPRPPDELALEALRSIESEQLWQRGKVKEYHTALSDVLRTYIERRFRVPAMESTSEEIFSSAPVAGLLPEALSAIKDVLVRSDFVKFAKFIPPPEQNEKSFAASVSFVELTRKARPAAEEPGTAAAPAPGEPETAGAVHGAGGTEGGAGR